MKLPKRLTYEFLIATALMLGSCDEKPLSGYDQFTDKQYDQISDIAREATAQDRERLDAIEEKLKMQGSND